jgi:hypothetical protein
MVKFLISTFQSQGGESRTREGAPLQLLSEVVRYEQSAPQSRVLCA